jgi:hypothetical protein
MRLLLVRAAAPPLTAVLSGFFVLSPVSMSFFSHFYLEKRMGIGDRYLGLSKAVANGVRGDA